MIYLEIILTGIIFYVAKHYYDKTRQKTVLIVAEDPKLLAMDFDVDKVTVKRLKDVRAIRDLLFLKPDAVVIDYNYQDKKAGRQLFRACEINKIPAIVVCNPSDAVCNIRPSDIVRRDQDVEKTVSKWLTRQCA